MSTKHIIPPVEQRTPIAPAAFTLLQEINRAGFEAFLVGGCVRDHILGLPIKDYDITTAATPDQIKKIFPDSERVGKQFGVCLVRFGGITFEIATFRLTSRHDHRFPNALQYTTNVKFDLNRRDFTMNAILMDANGKIRDMMEGIKHLRLGMLVACGSAHMRIQDDPLRMFRAARFAARLGLWVDAKLWEAIHIEARFADFVISKERIAEEINKILTEGRARVGFQFLSEFGLLGEVMSEVHRLRRFAQNPKHHPEGNVFVHTMGLLEQLPAGCSLTLALAALLHDTGKARTQGFKNGQPTYHKHEEASAEIAREVLRRLKYPNEVVSTVVSHCAQHMRFKAATQMRRSKLLAFVGQENFAELLALHRLDAKAGSGNMEHAEFVEAILRETPAEVLNPPKLVSGRDLIDRGFKPGPSFRTLLASVRVAQLEGTINTREEGLSYLASQILAVASS